MLGVPSMEGLGRSLQGAPTTTEPDTWTQYMLAAVVR